jgi:hypothetical protein
MVLARKPHTVDNRRRWVVDYCPWLAPGVTVVTGTVTSSSTTATIDGVAVVENTIVFFTNGGELNETFTASVAMTDSRGQIKNDTVDFFVVAP